MAENYEITPSSRLKPNQPESKKASRERSGGLLSDRRIQIAVLVAAVVIVLVSVVFAIGAIGRPDKNQTLQAQLKREKSLREREEAPHDSPTQPAQPVSGQSAIRETD